MRRADRRRRIAAWRHATLCALAAILAVAFFAGQIGTFVHFVRVKHASCPEHGLMFDVGVADRAPRRPDGEPSVWGSTDDGSHEHDHCAACLLSPLSEGVLALAPIDGATCQSHDVSGPSRDRAPFSARRYSLAPKQSPPLC